MQVPRRSLLRGAAATVLGSLASPTANATPPNELPVIGEFVVHRYEVCLNNARWHPMSRGAKQAIIDYLDYKTHGVWVPSPGLESPEAIAVRKAFASLIGATPAEVAFVNSTTAAENMIVAALGLHRPGKSNIVTDALHFEGSLYLYQELAKRGVDVRIVKPSGWQVDMRDFEAVVDANTRLISISTVSYINGFVHDLKAMSDLAHTHGAYVYADSVQAAGCFPLNVRESQVDFLATASYKWLMGDFGLGFLYVRENLLSQLQRTQWSFRQFTDFDYHAFPGDPAGPFPATYLQRKDAAGLFEIGTYANGVLAALCHSLPWIQSLGPSNIQKHALELNTKLRAEMPRLGFPCITPETSNASIVSFAVKDDIATAARLRAKKIDVGLSRGRMRVSPSIYNTKTDVEALLAALS